MKQLLSIAILFCFCIHSGNAQSFNYDFTTAIDTYVDLTGATSINNGEIWDQPTYIIPMGFPFELNGHAVTTFHFNGNGSSMASNTTVPFVVAEVFPFEVDLIDRGALGTTSLSPISYTVEGTPGSRIQKIEFNNAGSYFEMDVQGTLNMFVNFQCWLFEGSNNIEFHFGPNSINNPLLFYGGGNGPESGLTDYDEFDDLFMNGHFLIGSAANPFLSEDLGFINGTPLPGTVYHFTYLPPLNISVTGVNSTSYCQPNGSAQVEAVGGVLPYTYLWNTGSTTSSIDNLVAGLYSVTVQDANGSAATGSVTITNVVPMTVNITSTDETALAANDGTAEVFASGGLVPYNYLWSNGDTTALITGLSPGNYEVTVNDSSGCTSVQTIFINSFVCPNLTLEDTTINVTCFGLCNGSITILNVGQAVLPVTFSWNDGSTSSVIQNLCAGDNSVTVTDAVGCQLIATYSITEPLSIITNSGGSDETINGGDGSAWVVPTGGTPPYSFLWDDGSTQSMIFNLYAGEYGVTVTDAKGCEASEIIIVNAFCGGSTESFIQNNSCLDTCQWNISAFIVGGNGGPYTYQWSTGDTTQMSLDNLCPGQYGLTIQDVACIYTSNFLIIQPEPIITEVDTVIHLTDSTTTAIFISVISGPSPYSFSWYGPNGYVSNEEDLTGIPPGYYTVQVYNTFGNCSEIDSIEVLDQTVGLSPVSSMKMEIYPNPADDKVYVKLYDINEYQIQLITIDGQPLRFWKNTSTLDVHDVPPGIYLIKLTSGENSMTQPLLILR